VKRFSRQAQSDIRGKALTPLRTGVSRLGFSPEKWQPGWQGYLVGVFGALGNPVEPGGEVLIDIIYQGAQACIGPPIKTVTSSIVQNPD